MTRKQNATYKLGEVLLSQNTFLWLFLILFELLQVRVCVDVVSVERCDAPGGQMAVPTVPCFGMEALRLTDHGHGGLLFLLLDQ